MRSRFVRGHWLVKTASWKLTTSSASFRPLREPSEWRVIVIQDICPYPMSITWWSTNLVQSTSFPIRIWVPSSTQRWVSAPDMSTTVDKFFARHYFSIRLSLNHSEVKLYRSRMLLIWPGWIFESCSSLWIRSYRFQLRPDWQTDEDQTRGQRKFKMVVKT